MCKMASFWHNPNTGGIRVWDLTGHSETAEHLKLNEKYWREGHYLPDGTIECRVLPTDKHDQTACNERLRDRFPTFGSFLAWCLTQPLGSSLDLRGCDLKGIKLPTSVGGSLDLSGCDLKGIKLPTSVGGWLDLSGNEPGYAEAMKQFNANKSRTSGAKKKSAPETVRRTRKNRTTHAARSKTRRKRK
jgi:hypothetical protein